jgi:hypothetical protein
MEAVALSLLATSWPINSLEAISLPVNQLIMNSGFGSQCRLVNECHPEPVEGHTWFIYLKMAAIQGLRQAQPDIIYLN